MLSISVQRDNCTSKIKSVACDNYIFIKFFLAFHKKYVWFSIVFLTKLLLLYAYMLILIANSIIIAVNLLIITYPVKLFKIIRENLRNIEEINNQTVEI